MVAGIDPEHTDCGVLMVFPTMAGVNVPLAATFWLVAPVEAQVILPEGVPVAVIVNLT